MVLAPGYEDKAKTRRAKHGVDHPYAPDAPAASVETPLPATNKGYQMLEKMGWSSEQALGKTGSGISEPVSGKEAVSWGVLAWWGSEDGRWGVLA